MPTQNCPRERLQLPTFLGTCPHKVLISGLRSASVGELLLDATAGRLRSLSACTTFGILDSSMTLFAAASSISETSLTEESDLESCRAIFRRGFCFLIFCTIRCCRLSRSDFFPPLLRRKDLANSAAIKTPTPKMCSKVHTLLNKKNDKNRVVALRAVLVIDMVNAPKFLVIAAEHELPKNPMLEKRTMTVTFPETVQLRSSMGLSSSS
mmetsp:Transcript_22499/g.46888  ORF Transcript_22499/g.46888 Transcript_22499/m.46888 type:complete len:209 (+) Transcript_22499:358-984(+)